MDGLLPRIRFLKDSLPRAEKKVAQAILQDPEVIRTASLQKLARSIGSNDAAIIRFCRRLDYAGYTDFREALIESLQHTEVIQLEEIQESDSIYEVLNKVCASNMQILNDTLALASENYERALDILMHARSIHFFGCGDAASVCLLAYLKFSKLNRHCSAYTDPVMQLTQAGNLRPGDVAFAISYQGQSAPVNNAMRTAKENGATTICITKAGKSHMLQYIDIALFIATVDLSVGQDIVSRRVADQMIIEALYLTILAKSNGKYDRHIALLRNAIDRNKE